MFGYFVLELNNLTFNCINIRVSVKHSLTLNRNWITDWTNGYQVNILSALK